MPRIARAALLVLLLAAFCRFPAAAPAGAATQPPVALGAWVSGAPQWPALFDRHSELVGRSPAMLMWYQDWTIPLVDPSKLDAVSARGAVPMITWEAWDHLQGKGQPAYALRNIARGDFDSYLHASAVAAAAWRKPLFLRLGHEMNGDWYPWGRNVNGNQSQDFVAAWRRAVTMFRDAGANNVRWVWSPNVDYGGAPFTAYFPGEDWVDWAALDGYNWGSLHGGSGWKSLGVTFGASYDVLARLTRRPLMIAETASAEDGGNKAAWIRSAFLSEIPQRMPRIRAVVWFDQQKEADWRPESSSASLSAFQQVAASPRYSGGTAQLLNATPDHVSAARPARAAALKRRTGRT
jgi:hypothetical protein